MKSYRNGPHFPDNFDHSEESEIAQRVYKVLAKELNYKPKDLSRETKLGGNLELDSVDYVDIMPFLEDEFNKSGLELYLDDFERMITIGDLIEHIEGKVGEIKTWEV